MFLLSTFFQDFSVSAAKKITARKVSYHHGDLRRALMDEGLKVISREGATRINLRELARAVGVSHGAPYRHFESREELILELALEGATLFLRHLEEGRDAAGPDTRKRFKGMGIGYFNFAMNHPHHYRLIFNREVPHDLSGPKGQQLGETMQASFMALMGIVQEMQKAGYIREDDPFVLSSLIWSQMHGIMSLLIDGRFTGLPGLCGPPSEGETLAFFESLISYAMKGIGTGK